MGFIQHITAVSVMFAVSDDDSVVAVWSRRCTLVWHLVKTLPGTSNPGLLFLVDALWLLSDCLHEAWTLRMTSLTPTAKLGQEGQIVGLYCGSQMNFRTMKEVILQLDSSPAYCYPHFTSFLRWVVDGNEARYSGTSILQSDLMALLPIYLLLDKPEAV